MLLRNISHRTITKTKSFRQFSEAHRAVQQTLTIQNQNYARDDYTNVTDKILSHLGRNLHVQKGHPLGMVSQRVVDYFYTAFRNTRGNPQFSMWDNLSPVVSVEQNFDSLLIPPDHISRSKSDCYYLNRQYLLRAHMTAHQSELMKSGLDNFLMLGDVYRRDEIDSTHYPVFHQIDGVRLRTRSELFPNDDSLEIFELGDYTESIGTQDKQTCHTIEAVKLLEFELKTVLVELARSLFGEDFNYRWVDTYFPFTQPSWELEINYEGKWMEILGCGIMRQPILTNAGINNKVGWAFGLGLERLAMCLYKIPDIRLFWSTDSGFLNQFKFAKVDAKVIYKPVSQYPQCSNDISFWLPQDKEYAENDFYDLVRTVGGDIVEQVILKDDFKHPKTGKRSHCYRIVYRHMERTLKQEEVNIIHKKIEEEASKSLFVTIR
ncbi:probable phenylalanine--tRNA ligase, mitochondrial [Coccinella septempunctata]|uniref:probable phenylalanine--tRNA ligase, mitochondrial n=1 Tax=Coccinella septempunctata TaxID=41139 RepID=UPI001D091ADD|nr:probable phenylalanine--tRNA ligase, mitochondrial [Coccinella septempunctata]